MPYAEIVVNVPIGTGPQTFHYRIPPALAGRLQPGHLVTVPFGPRPAQGVIVALSDTSPLPDEEHKDVEGLVDEMPVLTPAQIALARWIADYYLCSLLDALLLMLPPGLDQRAEPTYRPASDTTLPADLADKIKRLLDIVNTRAPLDRSQMRATLTEAGATADDLELLVRQRLVVREWRLPGPRIGPKIERVAYIIIDRPRVQTEIDRLRGPWRRRAAVLQALRDAGGSLPLDTLVASADRSAVDSLAAKGWLRVEETAVTLTTDAEAVDAEIARLHATPRGGQTVALEILLAHDGPMSFSDLYRLAPITRDNLRHLEAKGLLRIEEREVRRDPLAGRDIPLVEAPPLTPDQERVWRVIEQGLQSATCNLQSATCNLQPATCNLQPATCYLLHGVTGSGKTEIYLRTLTEVVKRGRQAIVLVPEIALTPQTVHRFAARFPGRVAVLHSGLTEGQRYDEWRRARAGLVDVVIGARSAVFAPLPHLGLIVVDEEHEPSYKQDETPRYHARDVALKLAGLTGATVILGSATPAVETYRRAERGLYHLLELPQRIVVRHDRATVPSPQITFHELPPVQVVDMREELKAGNRSIFSRALDQALRDTLRAGEQAILFLNRRGAATFVLCRDCGHVLRCRRCDVPLTYHETSLPGRSTRGEELPLSLPGKGGGGEGDLVCHYCNRRYPQPARCPACGSPRIRYFGLGTQRVEAEVRKAYPRARLLRWDRDTATTGADHQRFLEAFVRRQADVLIGTQMVAKGLDLPLVTLVGVISADTALHFPDFRASERTFQLLAQVAGRAGRSSRGGRAIVQTYTPEHYAIQAAAHHDYAAFYRREIAFRREQGYPPFGQLARLVYTHTQEARAETEARRLCDELRARVRAEGLGGVDLIGPAPAYLRRLRGRYRWQIIVRATDVHPVLDGIAFGPGWSLDVDPVSLL